MSRRPKASILRWSILVVVLILLTSLAFMFSGWLQNKNTTPQPTNNIIRNGLTLHVLPVGKADCLLVTVDGKAMLVDAGNNGDGAYILEYLKSQSISKLDVLVATHPHEDHIGGMDEVLTGMAADVVYMSSYVHNTLHYEHLLDALDAQAISPLVPVPGHSFQLGSAAISFLAPLKNDYDEINDHSLVMRIVYGKTSFLLTGDMESASEKDLLESGQTISADVLKVAHHGSNSSSTKKFLNAVHPKIAIIAADLADKNPPSEEVIGRIEALGATVYQTYINGIIMVNSNGTNLVVITSNNDQ